MVEVLSVSIIAVIKVLVILFAVVLPGASASVYFERKISAWIQNRVGPNRTGPLGLMQPLADVAKLLFKEDIVPAAANKTYHFIAPVISITLAIAVFAVMPFGHYITIGDTDIYLSLAPDLNIALLYVFAMGSLAVYGITFAGWSSNNKYSLMGGLRSASQMISYELSMGLSVIGVLMICSSLNLNDIIQQQSGLHWNIFYQPLGFLIFLVSSFAETNRTPFDLPEAEPELVGGYHTEYAGMKFGIFFLAEYAHVIAASGMITTLFLGGWQVPFLPEILGLQDGDILLAVLQLGSFMTKLASLVFLFIWVRWSLPRFRYDQLMNLGWKVFLPLALLNILVTGLVMLFVQ
jgi:NADH-quinone oxidoreductase subunit H